MTFGKDCHKLIQTIHRLQMIQLASSSLYSNNSKTSIYAIYKQQYV